MISPRIIDLGTGSGCIPVALSKRLPEAKVMGVDISETALKTASRNASLNEVNVDFQIMDILSDSIPEMGTFDIVVSNPPYVTHQQKDRMEANVLAFEPHLALFVPDTDPLIFYKAITRFAKKTLNKGGSLYFEINEAISGETADAIQKAGFSTEIRKDLNNKDRMLKAILS